MVALEKAYRAPSCRDLYLVRNPSGTRDHRDERVKTAGNSGKAKKKGRSSTCVFYI